MTGRCVLKINAVSGQPEQFYDVEDLIFLYGSNMHPKQLAQRCFGANTVAVALLHNFKLSFYGYTEEWDGGLETAEPCEGEVVWGALMKIDGLECERLDQWMDARIDGGGMYFHYPAEVVALDGQRYRCRIYRKDLCDEMSLPSREYLAHIVAGALSRGLPSSYIDQLRSYASKPASYAVPVRCGGNLGMGAGVSCHECVSAAPVPVQEGLLCVLPSI